MKKVLIDPRIQVPGVISPIETLIDPEVDVLSDEIDPVDFRLYESVEVVNIEDGAQGSGVVTKVHTDEQGSLIQIDVDWQSFGSVIL